MICKELKSRMRQATATRYQNTLKRRGNKNNFRRFFLKEWWNYCRYENDHANICSKPNHGDTGATPLGIEYAIIWESKWKRERLISACSSHCKGRNYKKTKTINWIRKLKSWYGKSITRLGYSATGRKCRKVHVCWRYRLFAPNA